MNTRPAPTVRRRRLATLAVTIGLGAVGLGAVAPGTAEAAMTGPADVVCTAGQGTIAVTPKVISDHADRDQYTATRVWIATWNGSLRQWEWSPQQWKIELASQQNSPFGFDVSRLETQTFRARSGFHYVYVESWMWSGQAWYGAQGAFTQSYTNTFLSVSHEPDRTVQSSFCEL